MSDMTVQAVLLFNKKAKIINKIKDHVENGENIQTVIQTTTPIPRMDIKWTHYPSTEERSNAVGRKDLHLSPTFLYSFIES